MWSLYSLVSCLYRILVLAPITGAWEGECVAINSAVIHAHNSCPRTSSHRTARTHKHRTIIQSGRRISERGVPES